ncbi:hypothetical protein GP2143_11754 [marine gamma proteobacterium HTCC2143]|uniref:Uncharacterized protein n=1 Tax=marine gamma proteobacterium HTCC2143 TaxID=247633 RepID=A0YGZ7_9GAMM|nr:hypothetical protein GP2143_11754 [marine gamma proteobacterium HTCC2143]
MTVLAELTDPPLLEQLVIVSASLWQPGVPAPGLLALFRLPKPRFFTALQLP